MSQPKWDKDSLGADARMKLTFHHSLSINLVQYLFFFYCDFPQSSLTMMAMMVMMVMVMVVDDSSYGKPARLFCIMTFSCAKSRNLNYPPPQDDANAIQYLHLLQVHMTLVKRPSSAGVGGKGKEGKTHLTVW